MSFSDPTFGPRLLLLCTQGLFECLALNLYCLGGEQTALTAVINHRIVSIPQSQITAVIQVGSCRSLLVSVPLCVCVEEDVCRSQSQSDQLADQYDVHETACHSGTQPSY